MKLCMKCQILFSEKNKNKKKHISKRHLLIFLPSMSHRVAREFHLPFVHRQKTACFVSTPVKE